jgi:hypothetical protein
LLLGENDSVLTWFLYVLKPWIVMCLMWPMAAAKRAGAMRQVVSARAEVLMEAWEGRQGILVLASWMRQTHATRRRLAIAKPGETARRGVCARHLGPAERVEPGCTVLPQADCTQTVCMLLCTWIRA